MATNIERSSRLSCIARRLVKAALVTSVATLTWISERPVSAASVGIYDLDVNGRTQEIYYGTELLVGGELVVDTQCADELQFVFDPWHKGNKWHLGGDYSLDDGKTWAPLLEASDGSALLIIPADLADGKRIDVELEQRNGGDSVMPKAVIKPSKGCSTIDQDTLPGNE